MLIVTPCHFVEAVAVRTDMPLCFSTERLSVAVVPESTVPAFLMAPVRYRSCSVRVVLPESTWASIPML